MDRNVITDRVRIGRIGTVCTVLSLALALPVACASAAVKTPSPGAARSTAVAASPPLDYLAMPLAFEVHPAPPGGSAEFLARGDGYLMRLEATGASLRLRTAARGSRLQGSPPAEIRMRLAGADPLARGMPVGRSRGRVHYLRGSDPASFRTDVEVVERVRFDEVYDGISVVYYGRQRRLEYDFVVAPGAAPSAIALEFEGADGVHVDEAGDLVLALRDGAVRFLRPEVFQESGGGRDPVVGGYVVAEDGRVRFAIGAYDVDRPLIIDPVLTYSTYLAGSNVDEPFDVAVDDAGNAYVVGLSWSFDFPTTSGAWDETCGVVGECGDISGYDAFITKITPDGSSLAWSTFLGGSSADAGHSIAVDGAGRVFVTGTTRSLDFPVTADAIQSSPGEPTVTQDGFVTGIAADGASLFYSSYLGGSDTENHTTDDSGIALDAAGRVCVTGVTESSDFPVTAGAFDTTLGGRRDGFVVCHDFSAGTPTLTFATLLGGDSFDGPGGIAMDSVGGVYVGGWTSSSDFPTSVGAFDTTPNGGDDAFAIKFDADGNRVWATLIGGSTHEVGSGIAVDATGHAYLTGWRASASDFPTTPGAFDTTSGGGFVTKFNTTGSDLVYSTFLFGTDPEDVAVDGAGRASIVGRGWGAAFPVTPDAFQSTRAGSVDATFSVFDAAGADLIYATYLGGADYGIDYDEGRGVAVDPIGNAYVVGITGAQQWAETPFPTTPGAFDRQGGEYWSGFAARVGGLGGTNQADLGVVQSDAPDPTPLYGTLSYTVTVTNNGPDEANQVTVTETLAANVFFDTASGSGWACDGTANPVVCTRPLLAAGATAPDLVIEVTPFEAVGVFTATAAVSAYENDAVASNNMATVETIVDAPDCDDGDSDEFVVCGSCNPPAGLSCGDCGEYDPTSYPNAPELCDFYDNDCDGEVDEGLGPEGQAELRIDSGSRLWWLSVAGATAYDVVRGNLVVLREYGDLWTGSTCLADDLSALEVWDTENPASSGCFWYLQRAVDPAAGDCGNGSFESDGAGQSGSRDAWIAYGPCP